MKNVRQMFNTNAGQILLISINIEIEKLKRIKPFIFFYKLLLRYNENDRILTNTLTNIEKTYKML